MRIVDLIEKKKNGEVLTDNEISFIVSSFVNGSMPDYQMAALAMAIYFKGMTSKETAALTLAMMNSGDIIDLSDIKGIKVDKHSTGGVGDKVTLVVAPIIASLGIPVAKMSGRGLGFTGGTIDKLESIPGYNCFLSVSEFKKLVKKTNCAVIGQTDGLVPADKKLYALRDVTATVNSLPLITASIMSKKLATGSDAILLDVKCGDGAFMKTEEDAIALAKSMISIGKHLKRDVRAEITSMNQPLGKAIGNKNEVLEAIDTLNGHGPADFTELILSSCATILQQAKAVKTHSEGIKKVQEVINNGKALAKFKEWIKSQGGDVEILFSNKFWKPKHKLEVFAEKKGYMIITSAVDFGIAAMKVGAGRETKEDDIDFDAGITLNKQTNDKVEKGDLLFTIYSSSKIPTEIVNNLKSAYNIGAKKVENKILLGKLG